MATASLVVSVAGSVVTVVVVVAAATGIIAGSPRLTVVVRGSRNVAVILVLVAASPD